MNTGRKKSGLRARATSAAVATSLIFLMHGCSKSPEPEQPTTTPAEPAAAAVEPSAPDIATDPLKNAYFGDLHVHTMYSFDAFIFGTRNDPDAAYRFAKGEAIEHASGFKMQMKKPLDFQGVADHGVYLGMLPEMWKPESSVGKHPVAIQIREAKDPVQRNAAFRQLINYVGGLVKDDLLDQQVVKTAWDEIVASAERHNDPGKFTTFIAYEYTSSGAEFQNLHRNVIFRGSEHPEMPFTRLDSLNPEDLWTWMDGLRGSGIESLAIPHNSNGSDGWMFQKTNFAGKPIDAAYADQRMRNEPLVEATQVKGTSDTHPALSPNDEWADFEIMPIRVASDLSSRPEGSYVREAYLNGLAMEEEQGFNPYRFGLIGSSDTHNAAGSFEEDNYWSKTGLLDISPQQRGSVPLDEPGPDGEPYANQASKYWGASGLAGVWAESNTRDAIYAAFRRKETFATSGPHIKVRFFAGYDFGASILTDKSPISSAYAKGVPMGSDLAADGDKAPTFFTSAIRDSDSGPLQRLQIIKGWIAAGERQEQVYDIVCSDGLTVNPETHRCPDNGATVDLSDCSFSADKGATELASTWTDPDFKPGQRAFYYVRVLENPTCRWSTWDAVRAGVPPRPDMHATIQERAWTSPIWYLP
jgi:hypothetical protein